MNKKTRAPYLWEVVVACFLLVSILSVSLGVLKVEAHIPFIVVTALTALMAMRMGNTWSDIENAMLRSLRTILQALIILMMVGMVIGTWIQGGIVPSLVYYGLKLIHPQVFLVTIFLVCSICAVATGSSWTIIGTLGVAAMGISKGLQIPLPITAGIVVSAGYFGDKLSPLSDTPNLHCAIVGVNIFDNFKAVLKTTMPSYLLGLVACMFIGAKYAPKEVGDLASIQIITQTLESSFFIRPWLILPVLLVFLLVIFKIPAIPGIFSMAFTGALCAFFIQGSSLSEILNASYYGFVGDTGVSMVDALLTRGGLLSMMPIVLLILCAVSYSGVLEASGILKVLVSRILKGIKKDETLILATVLTCISINVVAMDNYITAVITGGMFKDAYAERGLHPLNLTRCLAEGASMVSPLIPWNTCGIVVFGMLGVSPLAYAPYAVLCWISPLVLVILAYLKIGILYLVPREKRNPKKSVINTTI